MHAIYVVNSTILFTKSYSQQSDRPKHTQITSSFEPIRSMHHIVLLHSALFDIDLLFTAMYTNI